MHAIRYTIAVLALGASFQAHAAPRELTFSAELTNITKDSQPVSSVQLFNGATYANGSVLPGKFTYDLQGPNDVVWRDFYPPNSLEWSAGTGVMDLGGTYALELGTLGSWVYEGSGGLTQINIYTNANGAFVQLDNRGMYGLDLTFRGPARSLDNAVTYGDVLDRVLLGNDFAISRARLTGEEFKETEWGYQQFVWTTDLTGIQFQDVSPVPEPGSAAMAATGLLLIGAVARRRRMTGTNRAAV